MVSVPCFRLQGFLFSSEERARPSWGHRALAETPSHPLSPMHGAPATVASLFLGCAKLVPLCTLALLAGVQPPHFHDTRKLVIQRTAQKDLSLPAYLKLFSHSFKWIHFISFIDLSQSEAFRSCVCVLILVCLQLLECTFQDSRNLVYFAIARPPHLSCNIFTPLGCQSKGLIHSL